MTSSLAYNSYGEQRVHWGEGRVQAAQRHGGYVEELVGKLVQQKRYPKKSRRQRRKGGCAKDCIYSESIKERSQDLASELPTESVRRSRGREVQATQQTSQRAYVSRHRSGDGNIEQLLPSLWERQKPSH